MEQIILECPRCKSKDVQVEARTLAHTGRVETGFCNPCGWNGPVSYFERRAKEFIND